MGGATDIMDGGGLVPGAGVKFLRTRTSSANFVLLNELNPLPNNNHNFFALPLKNHLSDQVNDIPTTLLAQKFCQTGHCITKVGLSHVCTHDQEGNEVAELRFPFKVTCLSFFER